MSISFGTANFRAITHDAKPRAIQFGGWPRRPKTGDPDIWTPDPSCPDIFAPPPKPSFRHVHTWGPKQYAEFFGVTFVSALVFLTAAPSLLNRIEESLNLNSPAPASQYNATTTTTPPTSVAEASTNHYDNAPEAEHFLNFADVLDAGLKEYYPAAYEAALTYRFDISYAETSPENAPESFIDVYPIGGGRVSIQINLVRTSDGYLPVPWPATQTALETVSALVTGQQLPTTTEPPIEGWPTLEEPGTTYFKDYLETRHSEGTLSDGELQRLKRLDLLVEYSYVLPNSTSHGYTKEGWGRPYKLTLWLLPDGTIWTDLEALVEDLLNPGS